MEQADMIVRREGKAYEEYGWMILSANAMLGIIAALITTLPPISWIWNPNFESAYPILGALGTALVVCNLFALVVILVPYRRYERWAWFTLWMLPLMWVSQFAFSPDVSYLVLALLTTVGLVLPYRRFFSGSQAEFSRVR
jgi:hypothetical protein